MIHTSFFPILFLHHINKSFSVNAGFTFLLHGYCKTNLFTERMRLMFHADRLIAAFDGSDDSKSASKAIDLSKRFTQI